MSSEARPKGNNATNEGENADAVAEASGNNSVNGSSAKMQDEGNPGEEYSQFCDRPIVCILEKKEQKQQRCRMFRVVRSKGKALASGGFGVTIVTETSGDNDGGDGDDGYDEVDPREDDSEQEDAVAPPKNGALDASGNHQTKIKDQEQSKESSEIPPSETKAKATRRSAEYLFIEEVLFLHEKGLLRALLSSTTPAGEETNQQGPCAIPTATNGDKEERDQSCAETVGVAPLDASQLYQLLPSLGIGLAVYRTYSHLRSQDFRVLRHDPDRYDILCLQRDDQETRRQRKIEQRKQQQQQQHQQQEEEKQQQSTDGESSLQKEGETMASVGDIALSKQDGSVLLPQTTNHGKQSLRLRRRVRESIQNAPSPSIPDPNIRRNKSNDSETPDIINICWDAYNPNSNFGKTHPGLPDFYVTATYYNVPTFLFSDLKILLREKCKGIPLKVATVSDSGTVVMFGVTDYGIPPLVQNPQTTN